VDVEDVEGELDGADARLSVVGEVVDGVDREMDVADISSPMREGIAVAFFLEREVEDVAIERGKPLRVLGDEQNA